MAAFQNKNGFRITCKPFTVFRNLAQFYDSNKHIKGIKSAFKENTGKLNSANVKSEEINRFTQSQGLDIEN